MRGLEITRNIMNVYLGNVLKVLCWFNCFNSDPAPLLRALYQSLPARRARAATRAIPGVPAGGPNKSQDFQGRRNGQIRSHQRRQN